MKIVRFKDGTFGIRKRFLLISYKFMDLHSTSHLWWVLGSPWIKDCKGSYEKVKNIMDSMQDRGEVVTGITNELCYHPEGEA